jgi:hypothetical protein
MKKTRELALAILAGSLVTSVSTFGDSPFSERDARHNAAIANSPRARESFPWLTRTTQIADRSTARPIELNNVRYLRNPRLLEQYPELARGPSIRTSQKCFDVRAVANRGFAASPRAKEEFPELRITAVAPECVCVATVCAR